MRILFLSTWHPNPPDNGSKIRVYQLVQALGERHEVSLISFRFGTAQTGGGKELGRVCRTVDTVAIDPFEANQTGALGRFLSLTPVVTRPIEAMRTAVQRRLADGDFAAVVASGAVMEKYAAESPGTTVLALEEHNSLSMMMHERLDRAGSPAARGQYWMSWQKTRRYERALYGRFDVVTLVSERDRAYNERYVHGKAVHVSVIPNGVDCERNRADISRPNDNTLVYNGAMTYQANYDAVRYFLRDIYPQIRTVVAEVTFKVTGSTEGVALDGLDLDESVTLTGYLEDVRPEVGRAAVCVIPLREGGGTRLKILEAMALGTPVVSTSKGAEGLAVRHGEHLLLADEPEQFARQTARLLEDESLRKRLASNGRRLVETSYDWRKIGRDYTELLEWAVTDKNNRKAQSAW